MAESLPFEHETIDAILSFDVFDHIQDVQRTLDECWRVLKPSGRLFVVFPSYYRPTEHHLWFVTKLPFVHYFFSREALIKAYCEILEERGTDANWYKRYPPNPEPWEKCQSINGTTLSQFRKFLDNNSWNTVVHSRKAIGTIGRILVVSSQKKDYPMA
jgi:SAM-dependent methyltransferase